MVSKTVNGRLAYLENMILNILQERREGLREYDLIEVMASQGVEDFEGEFYRDNLTMFQRHFLLFHCLYRLRDRLLSHKEGDLEIHCLKIRLIPYEFEDTQFPCASDALRDYYLDLTQLIRTTSEDVGILLDHFWLRYAAEDNRKEALRALGLVDPVSLVDIKAKYRRLVMEHHPDRGGNKIKFQAINKAMMELSAYYPVN